jgi:transposase
MSRKSSVKQSIPKQLRFTIFDFNKRFPTDDACLEELMELRFPGGIAYCKHKDCKQDRKHYRIAGRPVYGCPFCGTQISPMAGTIFAKSPTPLRLWFYAMYLMASTRCGVSAKQIQRETGVTYKCAWRMFKQLRKLLDENDFTLTPLGGTGKRVEMDESGFGPTTKRLGQERKDKTTVFAAVERGGKVRAIVADDRKLETLIPLVKKFVLPDSTVFTDDFASYAGLKAEGYRHRRINHSAGVYVLGTTHTQTVEGYWSLVKNGIRGVYHSVGKEYLQSYLNEYSFRYSRRHKGNLIFNDFLARVAQLAEKRPCEVKNQIQAS